MSKVFLSFLLLWLPLACSSSVRPLIVVGHSMEPALRPGQLALLHRDYYRDRPLERGHVVAFRWKGKVYVKRVHALAGEPVKLLCQTGYCMPLRPELAAKAQRMARRSPRFQLSARGVPSGHFFSLGDHQTASIDSRELGPIPTSAILGRVQSL